MPHFLREVNHAEPVYWLSLSLLIHLIEAGNKTERCVTLRNVSVVIVRFIDPATVNTNKPLFSSVEFRNELRQIKAAPCFALWAP